MMSPVLECKDVSRRRREGGKLLCVGVSIQVAQEWGLEQNSVFLRVSGAAAWFIKLKVIVSLCHCDIIILVMAWNFNCMGIET
jgi:hypothetical protein